MEINIKINKSSSIVKFDPLYQWEDGELSKAMMELETIKTVLVQENARRVKVIKNG